ncbi:unnamed protein product [Pleuronectes platessa]|uniref:Uncharacterized protein n=1 Tax=Pleuronectes platessa TaxID=8262 RepID=A0A9N7TKH5_PLEPL|nr:unnamed protein product [Pleuronectes platessa]
MELMAAGTFCSGFTGLPQLARSAALETSSSRASTGGSRSSTIQLLWILLGSAAGAVKAVMPSFRFDSQHHHTAHSQHSHLHKSTADSEAEVSQPIDHQHQDLAAELPLNPPQHFELQPRPEATGA